MAAAKKKKPAKRKGLVVTAPVKRRSTKDKDVTAKPRVGRPPKDPSAKSKSITVTLTPVEYEALERARQISPGVVIPRSDIIRVGVVLAGQLTKKELGAELAKAKGFTT